MNAYDLAVKQMNQLAANTFGFFSTTVPQPDGSVIAYRHDKKNLSDSKIVYKSGLDGFWVTRNYTGNDNTTVWENGFDSSGNAVMNILSVIGINFSWANGGTLTLGGGGNGNGRLVILNASGHRSGILITLEQILTKDPLPGVFRRLQVPSQEIYPQLVVPFLEIFRRREGRLKEHYRRGR